MSSPTLDVAAEDGQLVDRVLRNGDVVLDIGSRWVGVAALDDSRWHGQRHGRQEKGSESEELHIDDGEVQRVAIVVLVGGCVARVVIDAIGMIWGDIAVFIHLHRSRAHTDVQFAASNGIWNPLLGLHRERQVRSH